MSAFDPKRTSASISCCTSEAGFSLYSGDPCKEVSLPELWYLRAMPGAGASQAWNFDRLEGLKAACAQHAARYLFVARIAPVLT